MTELAFKGAFSLNEYLVVCAIVAKGFKKANIAFQSLVYLKGKDGWGIIVLMSIHGISTSTLKYMFKVVLL